MVVMTMAAACYPDEQLRVQEELDKVVGMGRCMFTRLLLCPCAYRFIPPNLSTWLGRLERASSAPCIYF